MLFSTRRISHGFAVQSDTALAPCKCTCCASSDAPYTVGGAFGAAMPDRCAACGDAVGGPADSRGSPVGGIGTTGDSHSLPVLEPTSSSSDDSSSSSSGDDVTSEESASSCDEGVGEIGAHADQTDDDSADDEAIMDEVLGLLGTGADVYVIPGASSVLRAEATIRRSLVSGVLDDSAERIVLDSGAALNLAS